MCIFVQEELKTSLSLISMKVSVDMNKNETVLIVTTSFLRLSRHIYGLHTSPYTVITCQ